MKKDFTVLSEAVAFYEQKVREGAQASMSIENGKHIVEWVVVSKPQLLEG